MCMVCTSEFNVVRRRHHCRGCGKVVCSTCSEDRVPLPYLGNTYGRVCPTCFETWSKENAGKDVGRIQSLRAGRMQRRDRVSTRQQAARLAKPEKFYEVGYKINFSMTKSSFFSHLRPLVVLMKMVLLPRTCWLAIYRSRCGGEGQYF